MIFQVIHEKFRQEDEEIFRQNMFKVSQRDLLTGPAALLVSWSDGI